MAQVLSWVYFCLVDVIYCRRDMMRRLTTSPVTRLGPQFPLSYSASLSRRIVSSSSQPSQRSERQRQHEEKMAMAHAAREERRKLQEQKFREAQLARDERQRQHEEKRLRAEAASRERQENSVQKQQQAKERRRSAQRKNAARSIPFWLGNNPRCFDMTMEILNLNTVKNLKKDGLSAEYKQLYLHSIPSFYQALVDDNEELLKDSLNALVNVGFADLKWAKMYRQRMASQADLDRLDANITKTKEKRDRQLANLNALQISLEEMKKEEREDATTEQSGFMDRALNVVSSLLGSSREETRDTERPTEETCDKGNAAQPKSDRQFRTPKEETRDTEFVLSKSSKLKRQQSAILDVEKVLERHNRTLKHLGEKRDSYVFAMAEQDYEKANEVVDAVMGVICQSLASHIHQRHSDMIEQYQMLDSKTDLTKPHEWYMHARLDRRKIIFHAGPTNSGKTYTALERLKTANKGLYLGPLRLLAAEIYETLTSAGIYTNLFTGQERREIPFATHSAATVEMAPTSQDFDVVVIDEIQMISDPYRGFAWTRALMGIRCKEIHVCGGLEAKDMVQKIADFCGDELEVVTYERFSALIVQNKSLATSSKALGSYKNVQPGDCIVAFSRNDIFAIKREIESGTNYKCCVIYGSLPPQTRTDQARRFNDPDSGYDILVASDAIGMGLNLNIRRIIFNSLYKYTGDNIVRLDHSSVKQISGRAGRRNSPFPEGEVTCRDPEDMEHLKRCMSTEIAPIRKAGLLPTAEHIEVFSEALKKYELGNDYDNLYKILIQFSEMATLKGDFFLCRQTPMQGVAKILSDVDLPLSDKYTLCMAPAQYDCSRAMMTLKQFASKYSLGQVSGVTRSAIPRAAKSFDDLSLLCSIHNQLELFIWLHNRFPGSNVMEQQAALALKERTILLINKGLAESERLSLTHCYLKRDASIRAAWKGRQKKRPDIDELDDYLPHSELDEI